MAWYYQALHQALAQRLPNSRSLLILERSVQALLQHLQEPAVSTPEKLQSWLLDYPQRHRQALFH